MQKFAHTIITVVSVLLLSSCGYLERDNVTAQTKAVSTAQANVLILSDHFEMPGLNRQRQIRIYLPPGYANSDKRYPVLYMHDAQNLFDAATSYAGEWNVDETLNALSASGRLELIVVGIDNGQEKRMTELNPWNSSRFGDGEGKKYVDFIVRVIKPVIDAGYRTKPDRENTAIMGSSLGGLISHYAVNQYPDVFSKAGIFSPSYWIADESFQFIETQRAAPDARLYMLMGGNEGAEAVTNVQRVAALLVKSGHPAGNMVLKIVPGGEHNEAFWSKQFEAAIVWLFDIQQR